MDISIEFEVFTSLQFHESKSIMIIFHCRSSQKSVLIASNQLQ